MTNPDPGRLERLLDRHHLTVRMDSRATLMASDREGAECSSARK